MGREHEALAAKPYKKDRTQRLAEIRSSLQEDPSSEKSLTPADLSAILGIGGSTLSRDYGDILVEDPRNSKHYRITGEQYMTIQGLIDVNRAKKSKQ